MSPFLRLAPALVAMGAVCAAAGERPAPEAIAAWIEQLGAEQFAQREAASLALAAAGREALGPLGAAIGRDDFEVASRALEIVRGFLASDDETLAHEAEQLLETVAEGPDSPVAQVALGTLDFHHRGMTEAARERLESLGAVVTEGFLVSGNRGLQATLNARWRGTPADLRLLARLRGLRGVGLFGVPVDAASVAALGRLRGLESLQLFGTGIGPDGLAALAAKLPDTRIDARKGGKLGVGGQPLVGPCLITTVQDGSAAAKAGVLIGDVVVAIDGEPVASFEALTERVGRHAPGDTIKLDIERATPGEPGQRLTREITLDGWE